MPHDVEPKKLVWNHVLRFPTRHAHEVLVGVYGWIVTSRCDAPVHFRFSVQKHTRDFTSVFCAPRGRVSLEVQEHVYHLVRDVRSRHTLFRRHTYMDPVGIDWTEARASVRVGSSKIGT